MNIKKLLGKRVKEIRKSKNYTQEYIAEKIGIEPQSLSSIETGKYYPTAENLEKILNALEVEPQELFQFDHLQNNDILKNEINNILDAHPEKIQTIYKILKFL